MWREVIAQLRAFVRRRIADPDRAEDLVADILLRIHQNLGSVDDQERLTHWVSRVARNAIIDEYRRAARAREQLLITPAGTQPLSPSTPRGRSRTIRRVSSTSCRLVCARCWLGCRPSNGGP
jgi:RNA polymerase sigma-70 factor (ECF subfamily)